MRERDMATEARNRSQLVIALGDGPPGQVRKRKLELAAKRAQMSLSEWSREVLLAAAGAPADTLTERVARLELRLHTLEGRVNG